LSPKPTRVSGKVSAVTVNFKTPQLIHECIASFLSYYPGTPYIVIDNGGCKESLRVIKELQKKHPRIQLVEIGKNIGHGPGLNQGLKRVTTPYALLLDSDTKTLQGGFLEEMLERFALDPKLFAIGWLRYVGNTGVATPRQDGSQGRRYVHPATCLLDVEKFRGLHPFVHSGAPAARLMHSALKEGYNLKAFPVKRYVWHKVGGTRGRFGGQFKVKTETKPGKWKRYQI
jgi:glycosyltransferase involved in cell wall biosynthesis